MDEGVKRKLVGAGVLMTIALVLWPLITPKKQNAEYLAKSVPLETDIPNMEMPLPKSIAVAELAPTVNTKPSSQAEVRIQPIEVDGKTSKAQVFEKPVTDQTGQALVWHIQVGSFAKPENATKLKNKLRKAGYKAFEKLSKDGKHVRVFVGPDTQKQKLDKQLKAIQAKFKLEGKIVPFKG